MKVRVSEWMGGPFPMHENCAGAQPIRPSLLSTPYWPMWSHFQLAGSPQCPRDTPRHHHTQFGNPYSMPSASVPTPTSPTTTTWSVIMQTMKLLFRKQMQSTTFSAHVQTLWALARAQDNGNSLQPLSLLVYHFL